jgi:hypothetical protein
MIKRNETGQIVNVHIEEQDITRDMVVAHIEKLRTQLAEAEQDLADFDALTAPAVPEAPSLPIEAAQ